MHIFELIPTTTNDLVKDNTTWHRNLYEPLIDMRHKVKLMSLEEGRLARQKKDVSLRARFSQKVLDYFQKEHRRQPFDLFFSYLMDGMIDPAVIDEISKQGVPTCNFSCNNIHQFDIVTELSPHFDYNLHAEKEAAVKFTAIGATPLWWPMASNPKYFKPAAVPRIVDVSFVGANYALRARYIFHLLKNGVDVHAYGPGWVGGGTNRLHSTGRRWKYALHTLLSPSIKTQSTYSGRLADHDFRRYLTATFPNNLHSPVSDDKLIALYSESKISLGFLEVYDRHDPSDLIKRHVHLREFEAPMAGALYCTNYMDELCEHFEPDREMIMYRNQYELLDKVTYYLQYPQAAEQIRQAGHARAVKDHTYHQRFKHLFNKLGLKS